MPRRIRVESELVASSRVSRFHNLSTTTGDVDISGINISIGDRILLEDSDLRLCAGTRYGLVGRNGTGKSTLLKCLSDGTLVDPTSTLRIMLVEQLDLLETESSVINVVLDSIPARSKRTSYIKKLSSSDQDDIAKRVIKEYEHDTLLQNVILAKAIAEKRSGQRGAEARRDLVKAEAALKAFSTAEDEVKDWLVEAQLLLNDLQEQALTYGEIEAEAKARVILKGLGFTTNMQDDSASVLSGGWKMRASLAAALLDHPDVLMLDEPTNHLDLPGIIWLEKYLKKQDMIMLVISHDREFLDAVCDETFILKGAKLIHYNGNYTDYKLFLAEKTSYLTSMQDSIEKQKQSIVESVNKNKATAARTGNSKLAKQAASKERKLDRLGMNVNDAGHRFKLNRDRAGWHDTVREDVAGLIDKPDAAVKWSFPPQGILRSSGHLLEANKLNCGYKSIIVRDINITIDIGSRIAVVGRNGCGKSTVLRTLAGVLAPRSGSIIYHSAMTLAFFSQESVLKDNTPLELLSEVLNQDEKTIRAHLAQFGLTGGRVVCQASKLSGGERVRLQFAIITHKAPHLLIIDEPTNHLDLDTTEALISALKEYTGAILITSHDRYLLREIKADVYLLRVGILEKVANKHESVDFDKLMRNK